MRRGGTFAPPKILYNKEVIKKRSKKMKIIGVKFKLLKYSAKWENLPYFVQTCEEGEENKAAEELVRSLMVNECEIRWNHPSSTQGHYFRIGQK